RAELAQRPARSPAPRAPPRASARAGAQSQIAPAPPHPDSGEPPQSQRLAGPLLYNSPDRRAPASVLAANRQGQPGLWRHGISGDKPIVVVRIGAMEETLLARQLLRAHAYWRLKGLEGELVILNEESTSYIAELYQELQ